MKGFVVVRSSFVRRVNLLLNILNFKTYCFFKILDFENSLFSKKVFENKTTIENRHSMHELLPIIQ